MLKKILIGIVALFVIGGIFSSLGGGEESSADDTITATADEDATSEEAAEDSEKDSVEPTKAEKRAAKKAEKQAENTIGNWYIMNKPKFGEQYGMFDTVDLKVKNVSDSEDEPWLEIRLTKGNELVTTFDCIGRTVEAGQVTTLECSSLDDYRDFTDYEIQNAF